MYRYRWKQNKKTMMTKIVTVNGVEVKVKYIYFFLICKEHMVQISEDGGDLELMS